jgi:hypothetical protein
MQFSPFSRHLIPLRSKYPPQHPVLKHLQLCFSLNVRDQVSHPYRTAVQIKKYKTSGSLSVVMNISIFWGIYLRSPLEVSRSFRGIYRLHLQSIRINHAKVFATYINMDSY